MDASSRQALLEGERIAFGLQQLITSERITVLERVRRNCRPRLQYFTGFQPLENEVFSWRLNLAKQQRLSCGYNREIVVEYAGGVGTTSQATKLCELFFEPGLRDDYQAEFYEPVLYLGQDGGWLLWNTHYKAADPMPFQSEPGQRGIRLERRTHTAFSSKIVPISSELLDSRYLIHHPEMLGWIILALIKMGEKTITQREHWLGELRDYVREQQDLAKLLLVS